MISSFEGCFILENKWSRLPVSGQVISRRANESFNQELVVGALVTYCATFKLLISAIILFFFLRSILSSITSISLCRI